MKAFFLVCFAVLACCSCSFFVELEKFGGLVEVVCDGIQSSSGHSTETSSCLYPKSSDEELDTVQAFDPENAYEYSPDTAQTSSLLSASIESLSSISPPATPTSSVEEGDGYAVHVYFEGDLTAAEKALRELVSILRKLKDTEIFSEPECDEIGENLLYLLAGRPVRGYELSKQIPSDFSPYMPAISATVVAPCFARKTDSDWVLVVGRMRFRKTMFMGLLISPSGIEVL